MSRGSGRATRLRREVKASGRAKSLHPEVTVNQESSQIMKSSLR